MNGVALNRAIYGFAAVTIIYTPLGFVAVGKHYLDDRYSTETLAGALGIAHPEYYTGRR